MKVFKFLFLALIITSCSAQWHLKRAIKKDPNILKGKDTTIVFDTMIVTKDYYHEDTFSFSDTDTIRYEDTVIKMRIIVKDKKIYTRIEQKHDSIWIHKTRTVKITKIVNEVNYKYKLIIGLILLYLLYKIIKFIRND